MTRGFPPSTEPPPLRIALIPDAARMSLAKKTRTRVGATLSTVPSPGTLRRSLGWAQAVSGRAKAQNRARRKRARAANASRKLAVRAVSFSGVLFRQFVDDDLGCASYLIGDPSKGEAFLVDPAYAIEQYLAAADEAGVRIVRVLETHTHADHVSGHGRFALERGVPISVHPLAEPEFPFDPLEDGQELSAGSVSIRVIHTPGHRPEHCAFVVDDRLVLTGDSLFIGDAARPDLAIEARQGAEGLFHSLQRLTQLPDAYEVYPGHVAGSLCGAAMSPDHSSTIGNEKRTNAKLEYGDAQSFINATASLSTPRPPTTARVVALNKERFVGARVELDELERLLEDGAVQVIDVREKAERDEGYIPGSLHIPFRLLRESGPDGLDTGKPVVTICESGMRASIAASVLTAAGVEARPVLHGGVNDWPGGTVSFRRCGGSG